MGLIENYIESSYKLASIFDDDLMPIFFHPNRLDL